MTDQSRHFISTFALPRSGAFLLLLSATPLLAAPAVSLKDSARSEIGSILQEKASWTPVQKKIESQLIQAFKRNRGEAFAPGAPHLRLDVKSEADGRVLVDIQGNVTSAVLAQIKAAGGEVISSHPQFNAVRALIRLEQAESIAALSDVKWIQRAELADYRTGTVDSAGDIAHQALAVRSTLGVTGAGVKIGVLSDSVDYYTNSQATGDLGPITILPGQSGLGGAGAGEGTAMLEIIHDLAPGAQLYFATADGGQATFAQNILNLQSAGCNILVDDVGYFSESPFQDGTVAKAVDTVTGAGVLYFSACGNSGNLDSGTSGTWEGDFLDGGPAGSPITQTGRLHSFGPTTYNTVAPGGSELRADLFWSDPLGASANDYDLFILDSTGTSVVASSTNPQNGSQDPYESVSTLNPGEQIVIVKFAGQNRFLHLSSGRGVLTIATRGAIGDHSVATNMFSIAAVDVMTAYPNAFTGGSTNPVEQFSSDGPRHIFFDAAGNALTPGNFSSTGGLIRQKPDLAAADDVQTTVPGFQPFSGTSAAAPHAAAIAGLLKSYNPALTPAQVRAVLTSSTLDIMAPGTDRDAGYGLMMATALMAAPPGSLLITPGTGYIASGPAGGPISVVSAAYTLTNSGAASFNWQRSSLPAWLNPVVTSGTLTPGGPAAVLSLTLSSTASNLPPGLYVTNLWITNLTAGAVQSRTLTLSVTPMLPNPGSYAGAVAALNAVVYWRLNETNQPPGPDVVTNSGSLGTSADAVGYDGVIQGQPGIVGTSSRFSNPSLSITYFGSHVDIPYNPALNPNGPFTIELWVMPAQIPGDLFSPAAALDLSQNGGNSRNGWVVYQNGNAWQFRVGGFNGYAATVNGGTAQTNVWQQVVGVYDGANASLYVNGARVAGPTAASGFSPNATVPFRIGATTIPNRTFDGWVDEVAFYGSALSSSAIAAHYAAATTNNAGYPNQVLAANPLGYWRLESPPYTAPTPQSLPIMSNSGTLAPNGNGRFQTGSLPGLPGVPFWALGANNYACGFAGTSFSDCPGTFLNITGPLTLIAWVNCGAANGSTQSLISKGAGSYYLQLDGSGFPHFAAGDQPVGDVIGSTPVTDGQWHQLVGVYDAVSSESLYVDGQLVASTTGATAPVPGNSSDVWLGDAPDAPGLESLNGVVDEVSVFTNALSINQVEQLYSIATTIPSAPFFTGITRTPSGVVNLSWTSTPGYTYLVQYASVLKPAVWTNLVSKVAFGATLSATDSAVSLSPRFYRVLVPQ